MTVHGVVSGSSGNTPEPRQTKSIHGESALRRSTTTPTGMRNKGKAAGLMLQPPDVGSAAPLSDSAASAAQADRRSLPISDRPARARRRPLPILHPQKSPGT